jgi:hypothetical protein
MLWAFGRNLAEFIQRIIEPEEDIPHSDDTNGNKCSLKLKQYF